MRYKEMIDMDNEAKDLLLSLRKKIERELADVSERYYFEVNNVGVDLADASWGQKFAYEKVVNFIDEILQS